MQRYQLAVDQAKVRLNLVVAPMAWLMPANMIINTARVDGYNNKLKQAVSGTKLGVNNGFNRRHKKGRTEANGWGSLKNQPSKQAPC